MKEVVLGLFAIVFAAVLAFVVGWRLSDPAMAVVIGIMFGWAAYVLFSIALAVWRYERRR